MWKPLWPGQETPIGHVTNGVHLGTWLDPRLAELLRAAGVSPEAPPDEANWERRAATLDAEALWQVHAAAKARLAERAGIDRERLTIGFARRFATYKRAGLVFSDLERLLALPVQIVVAGKAHPADDPGQGRDAGHRRARPRSRAQGRVVFLENYDIGLARTLVRGCDVWLNTPTRPLEASGTSGMKAAVNGVLNLSVLDGWWAEAYCARARLGDRRLLRRRRPRAALPPARGGGRADLHGRPRAVGGDDEGVDRAAGAALLDAPRGDRVRRALLPAGPQAARS